MAKVTDVLRRIRRQQQNPGGWIEFTDSAGEPFRFPWLPVFGVVLALILLIGILDIFHLRPRPVPPTEVWRMAQTLEEETGLDASFLYAIGWAESSFNAHARSSVARGLMQMTRPAWKEIQAGSYGKAFSWQKNMRAGARYLLFCREALDAPYSENYPHLAAAYRFGPYRVKAADYDLSKLPPPQNTTYRALFQGNLTPEGIPSPTR